MSLVIPIADFRLDSNLTNLLQPKISLVYLVYLRQPKITLVRHLCIPRISLVYAQTRKLLNGVRVPWPDAGSGLSFKLPAAAQARAWVCCLFRQLGPVYLARAVLACVVLTGQWRQATSSPRLGWLDDQAGTAWQRKCSNKQRMIALSTSLFRSPADNLTHWTERTQLRLLNNGQCRFDNGFTVVQNNLRCSLSCRTSNGTTQSSHRTFSFERS